MKTRIVIVLALIALFAVPFSLFAQEAAGPEAVLQGLVEAYNAGDVETALTYYTEDAVVDIRPHALEPDAPFEGHEGIRTWLERSAANNTHVDVTVESVEDGRIITTNRVTSDQVNQMGIDSILGTDELVVEDGQIVSHTFTFSEEAIVQMQAAMAAAQAQAEQEMGFTTTSVAGNWALTYSIAPGVAAGVGTCSADSAGTVTCSAVGSFPGENGERMHVANEESGTITVTPTGMIEVATTRTNPDGSEAGFHYDCVVTEAEEAASGLQANEMVCVQREAAGPSGALSTSTMRRLPGKAASADGAATNEITFTATDYAFAGPESIPAGWTHIRLVNEGQELHHAQLIKLPADKSMDDLFAAMQEDPTHPPEWLAFAGGPSVTVPGDDTAATVELTPGQYVIICVIDDDEGVSHAAHGMVHPLTVTEKSAANATPPEADITLTMFDFNFALSDEITPGTHTFHVVNEGPQPHEVAVVQLAPGTSPDEFLASIGPDAEGPPLGRPVGGLQVIDTGEEGYFNADFEAGTDYLLICFHPDLESGAPHFALGMMQVISLTE